jgi:ABC-type sugar transport system ATPase subunit
LDSEQVLEQTTSAKEACAKDEVRELIRPFIGSEIASVQTSFELAKAFAVADRALLMQEVRSRLFPSKPISTSRE